MASPFARHAGEAGEEGARQTRCILCRILLWYCMHGVSMRRGQRPRNARLARHGRVKLQELVCKLNFAWDIPHDVAMLLGIDVTWRDPG